MKIAIPGNRPKAMLWDLDGTIVDSAFYHKQAWRDTFRGRGIDFTDDIYNFTLGRRNDEIIYRYIRPDVSREELNAIAAQKERTFRRYIKNNIRPFPFAIEMIKLLAASEFQLAVVSSATIENIRLITETLCIKSYFNLFVTGKDVVHGKPDPEGFLMAAKKLGVQPQNCIVVEDATTGVRAAKKAGMYCIAVTNTCLKQDLLEADVVVNRLDEITIPERFLDQIDGSISAVLASWKNKSRSKEDPAHSVFSSS